MMQRLQWVWLVSAAIVLVGVLIGAQPIVALGIGLAASLALSGSI
jgi:hypothetical protein